MPGGSLAEGKELSSLAPQAAHPGVHMGQPHQSIPRDSIFNWPSL